MLPTSIGAGSMSSALKRCRKELPIDTHHFALFLTKVQVQQPLAIVSGPSKLLEWIRPD